MFLTGKSLVVVDEFGQSTFRQSLVVMDEFGVADCWLNLMFISFVLWLKCF